MLKPSHLPPLNPESAEALTDISLYQANWSKAFMLKKHYKLFLTEGVSV